MISAGLVISLNQNADLLEQRTVSDVEFVESNVAPGTVNVNDRKWVVNDLSKFFGQLKKCLKDISDSGEQSIIFTCASQVRLTATLMYLDVVQVTAISSISSRGLSSRKFLSPQPSFSEARSRGR